MVNNNSAQKLLLTMLAIMTGLVVAGYVVWQVRARSQAAGETIVIPDSQLSQESGVVERSGVTTFSLFAQDDAQIYESQSTGAAGAYEFLQKDINVDIVQDVQGVSSDSEPTPSRIDILPPHIAKNLKPTRVAIDAQDPVLAQHPGVQSNKHYYFTQTIQEVPLYGSSISVHMKDDKAVYAMLGSYVNSQVIEPQKISLTQAQEVVIAKAKASAVARPKLDSSRQVVVNQALLGTSSDGRNIPALEIKLSDGQEPSVWAVAYYVSLVDGSILHENELVLHALTRAVCDYSDISPTDGMCPARTENTLPSPVADVENMYQHLGAIYGFFNSSFQRDSYNNAGARLEAIVDIPDTVMAGSRPFCPNAAWSRDRKQFLMCTNFAVLDVVAHEYTHAVVDGSAQLQSGNQSGALNEGLADVFATGADTADWLIGEDLPVGYLRDISDPSKNRTFSSGGTTVIAPAPDRMFSPQYYCGTGDSGGVHINLSVASYAHYLMAAGGTFNMCQIGAIGMETSLKIWYLALTRYLGTTANFRDMYNGMIQACTDLHGANSTQCVNMTKALRAVEMDQQPLGTQQAAKCSGVQAQPPQCNIANPDPCPTKEAGDADCDGTTSVVDYAIWRSEYLGDLGDDRDGDGNVMDADFDKNGVVSLVDYAKWKIGVGG